MAKADLTKNCAVCQKKFIVRTNNRKHAKFCSKACCYKFHSTQSIPGQVDGVCVNCGSAFRYRPRATSGKYCSRKCRDEHWKKPSAERGFIDLSGQTFGRWTVLSHAGLRKGHHSWLVRCSCEATTEKIVNGQSLLNGTSKSCGCLAREAPLPETYPCSRCGKILPYTAEFFIKSHRFRSGLAPSCKKCWGPISKARHTAWRRKLKAEVLSHYSNGSPHCACCGVAFIEFLTLDHINDDGNLDRKVRGQGMNFYSKLKQANYPSGLQCLCFNCNIAKSMFGRCPCKIRGISEKRGR